METTTRARRRAATFRRVGWLAVAALMAVAMLGPSAALARSDLNVTVPFGQPYAEASNDCSGPFANLPSGQMGWHFIQNQTDATSGTLTVTFDPGGTQVVESADTDSNVLHWYVFSAAGATLTAASTNVGVNTDQGNFNLSHICLGTTTTTSSSTIASTTTQASIASTTTQASIASTTTQATTTQATTTASTTSTTTGGGVLAATATPRATPPPTDALPTSGSPGGDTWRLALLAIAGLLATLLLLAPATPAKARRRR